MRRLTFIDHAIRHLLRAEEHARGAERVAGRDGFLHQLDPRAGVVCAGTLLIAAAVSRSLAAIVAIFALVTIVAFASALPLQTLTLRVWPGAFLLTSVIVAPALITTPGIALAALPWGLGAITEQGLRSALFLIARVETAATISYVLIVTTTWPRLLAAMRHLGAPSAVVLLLGMTYRYVFLLMHSAHEMLLSRRSRTVGQLSRSQQRTLASAMMGSLMMRSLAISHDVHHAMLARGFRGRFDTLDEFELRARDGIAVAIVAIAAALTVWRGI